MSYFFYFTKFFQLEYSKKVFDLNQIFVDQTCGTIKEKCPTKVEPKDVFCSSE